jgi:hypothetical protein
MRLETERASSAPTACCGELANVVIDPETRRLTHLVVRGQREPWVERLVPAELAEAGDETRRTVTLRATAEEVDSLPPAQEVAYLQLGDCPPDDPDWDVGIQEVYAVPHYPAYDLQPTPLDFPILYDRIPKERSRSGGRRCVLSRGAPPRLRGRLPWSTATSTSRTSSSSAGNSGAAAR